MNKPYVKEYDENGVVTNPINGSYFDYYKNRTERRRKIKFRT